MKKEFVVSKVEAPQDGSSYVIIILTDTKGNFSRTRRQQGLSENPFGIATIPITSLDDLKELPKKISDAINAAYGTSDNSAPNESTTLKMTQKEFQELDIKKGDKISLEIEIANGDIANRLHSR
jgi:hypothetical protein